MSDNELAELKLLLAQTQFLQYHTLHSVAMLRAEVAVMASAIRAMQINAGADPQAVKEGHAAALMEEIENRKKRLGEIIDTLKRGEPPPTDVDYWDRPRAE